MRLLVTLVSILVSVSSFAQGEEGVFGLPAGTYTGSGVLHSSQPLVPDIKFESVRVLKNGIILAKTTAKLFGMKVGGAQARLKVSPTGNGQFDLLDLDNGNRIAGKGVCAEQACKFKATVMNGELTLAETWVPTSNGFNVVSGAQVFKGLASNYQAKFAKVLR